MGYVDTDVLRSGFGVFRDGEIHFRLDGRADNGLRFRGRVEIEAFTTRDQIDENRFSAEGGFGALLIGGADTALNEHGGVGVVYPSGGYLNHYDGDTRDLPGDPGSFVGKDDGIGIRYWIDAHGFQLGASWQPERGTDGAGDSNGLVVNDGPDGSQTAFGAHWAGDLGPVGLKIGGGYLFNDDEDIGHVGAEVGVAGVTLAGFRNFEDRDLASDLDRFGIGAQYAAGPWVVGGGYAHQDFDAAPDTDFVHVGGSYALAPGVTACAAVQWGEGRAAGDGVAVYTWLGLVF